ncbi:MAG: hypothetical protein KJ888_20945 [Gammaproteobacteria bacterium]|nr:hypothetical protein [Gammaproteobacteria bacterium]MBU2346666.1 hypothetical protein [Gammaproteobacteria bacterium]
MDIIETLARNLRDLVIDGNVGTASNIMIGSDDLTFPQDDQPNGYELYIYSGGGYGQARTITDFNSTSNQATVPSLTEVPSTNAKFMVLKSFKKSDYDNFVDRALGQVKLSYLERKVATMALVASQYSYVVPSGWSCIQQLRFVPSGHSDYSIDSQLANVFDLPTNMWRLELNPAGTCNIIFDPRRINLDNFDNNMMHIVGQAAPDMNVATMSGKIQEYVIAKATALMASTKISDSVEWQQKFAIWRDTANDLLPFIQSRAKGREV